MEPTKKREKAAKLAWYLLNNRLIEAKIAKTEAKTLEIKNRLANGNKISKSKEV